MNYYSSGGNKFLNILITIAMFLFLSFLFALFLALTALLLSLIFSIFSDSPTASILLSLIVHVRGDGGIGLIYAILYGIPCSLSCKIVTAILRNNDDAAKWTLVSFGIALLLVGVPSAIYYLFAAGSALPAIALSIVGGYYIYRGKCV